MTTLLPKDADNNIIPALRLRAQGGAHAITSSTSTSARNTTSFSSETKLVSLYCTEAVYVRFGGSSITATTSDHYFPQGIYYDFAISGGDRKGPRFTHVAVLGVSNGGTVYISEKE